MNISNNKLILTSSAFPDNISSVKIDLNINSNKSSSLDFLSIHQILSNFKIDAEYLVKEGLVYYEKLELCDLNEVYNLHKEWFPVRYSYDYFKRLFNKIENKRAIIIGAKVRTKVLIKFKKTLCGDDDFITNEKNDSLGNRRINNDNSSEIDNESNSISIDCENISIINNEYNNSNYKYTKEEYLNNSDLNSNNDCKITLKELNKHKAKEYFIIGISIISLVSQSKYYADTKDDNFQYSFYDYINPYLYLEEYLSCGNPRLFGYINTIGVIDEFRNFGIAKQLLNHAIIEMNNFCYDFTKIGMISVYLHVVEYNKQAIKFYIKNGFKEFIIDKDYYCIRNVNYNACVFVKIINDEYFLSL